MIEKMKLICEKFPMVVPEPEIYVSDDGSCAFVYLGLICNGVDMMNFICELEKIGDTVLHLSGPSMSSDYIEVYFENKGVDLSCK